MRRHRRLLGLAPLLLLAACATRSIDLAPDRPDRPWVPATDASGEIQPGTRPVAGGDRTYSLPANTYLSSLPPTTDIDRNHAYSLPELVDIAETANPTTRLAWDEAKVAALAVGLVRATYLPRLTASAAGIAETSHEDKALNASSANGNGDGQGAIGSVSLEWLLFDFGERRAVVKAAQELAVVSDIHFDATHQEIVHDVSVAFYAASSAHDETANAERSLADTLIVQDAVEQRRAHGQSTVVEVALARQASAQARLGAVQARGHEVDARITLLTAMGISPLSELKLTEIPYRLLSSADGRDAEAAVSRSLARRPDMLAALANERAAEEGVEAARADFRPKVFLSAGASYHTGHLDITALPGTGSTDGTDNLTSNKRDAHAILGITIPLYDGGTRSARLEQARARADGATAQLESARDLAIHEIVVARTTVETSIAACAAADELMVAAQTSFDAALGSYRSGIGGLTDVETAEISLVNARNDRSVSFNTALTAAASLALATVALSGTPGLLDQR